MMKRCICLFLAAGIVLALAAPSAAKGRHWPRPPRGSFSVGISIPWIFLPPVPVFVPPYRVWAPEYYRHDRRHEGVWVPGRYERVWVPEIYDRKGGYRPGHFEMRYREGEYRDKKYWKDEHYRKEGPWRDKDRHKGDYGRYGDDYRDGDNYRGRDDYGEGDWRWEGDGHKGGYR